MHAHTWYTMMTETRIHTLQSDFTVGLKALLLSDSSTDAVLPSMVMDGYGSPYDRRNKTSSADISALLSSPGVCVLSLIHI